MQNASDDAFSPFVTQVCHPGVFDISSVILCFLTRDSSNTQIIATYLPTQHMFCAPVTVFTSHVFHLISLPFKLQ